MQSAGAGAEASGKPEAEAKSSSSSSTQRAARAISNQHAAAQLGLAAFLSIRHKLKLVLHYLVHRIAAADRGHIHRCLQRIAYRVDEPRVCGEDHADPIGVDFTRRRHDE